MADKSCSQCGRVFPCEADGGRCWCMQGPPGLTLPLQSGQGCLCPDCLVEALKAAHGPFDPGTSGSPRPAGDLQPGVDYHMEQGRLVFSSWYLLKRGFCCGNGCRNCPYGQAT